MTALEARMFEYKAFSDKGILPRPGGLNAQHPLVVSAILAIMAEESEILRTSRNK